MEPVGSNPGRAHLAADSSSVPRCLDAARRSAFRKSIAEDGNQGANGDKIAMFGEGTGGYISLASSTISDYNDIIVDDMGNPIASSV